MIKKVVKELTHIQKVRVLYKTILRLHRGLPPGLKTIGDQYAKDEFKRHKTCNPAEAQLFMNEWAKYAVTLSKQLGLRGKPKDELGDYLGEEALQNLRDEQIVQLYELMVAAREENPSEEDQEKTHDMDDLGKNKK